MMKVATRTSVSRIIRASFDRVCRPRVIGLESAKSPLGLHNSEACAVFTIHHPYLVVATLDQIIHLLCAIVDRHSAPTRCIASLGRGTVTDSVYEGRLGSTCRRSRRRQCGRWRTTAGRLRGDGVGNGDTTTAVPRILSPLSMSVGG